jgi:hypothetical protein
MARLLFWSKREKKKKKSWRVKSILKLLLISLSYLAIMGILRNSKSIKRNRTFLMWLMRLIHLKKFKNHDLKLLDSNYSNIIQEWYLMTHFLRLSLESFLINQKENKEKLMIF